MSWALVVEEWWSWVFCGLQVSQVNWTTHTHMIQPGKDRHTGLSEGFSKLINRETLTSIEDLSLVESPNYCLLPVTFVDLHQACPRGVVASFSAHPEHIAVHVWALAHGALKAESRNAERRKRTVRAVSLRKSSLCSNNGVFNLFIKHHG